MNLTATTHTLEFITSSAETINYSVSWTDIDKSGASTVATPGSNQGVVSSATTTVFVSAPGASVYRAVTSCSFKNAGVAVNTVTVQKDVSATNYQTTVAILAAGESLHYEDGNGWYVLDDTGSRKGVGATGANGINGGGTILGTGTTTVDFGAGASNVSATVTGLTDIPADSLVQVWVQPTATADHSADEHIMETLKVDAHDVIDGVGFTITASNTNNKSTPRLPFSALLTRSTGAGAASGPGIRPPNYSTREFGGRIPTIKGQWTVAYTYTQ